MTAGIAAAMLCESLDHVTDIQIQYALNNSLFDFWVNQVDPKKLPGLGDLESPDRRVRSLLESTCLDKIVSDASRFNRISGQSSVVFSQ